MSAEGIPNKAILEARAAKEAVLKQLQEREAHLQGSLDQLNARVVAARAEARKLLPELDQIRERLAKLRGP